ncbi:MAG TPA: hypothetical protein DDY31_07155 [Lachnospiraceae bacterium]|nr:hypothetical protein [Lachnospiraceae bacterium]
MGILGIIYMIAGYWAVGETIYANKIRIGTAQNLFLSRFILGFAFGFILIPIAIIKKIIMH